MYLVIIKTVVWPSKEPCRTVALFLVVGAGGDSVSPQTQSWGRGGSRPSERNRLGNSPEYATRTSGLVTSDLALLPSTQHTRQAKHLKWTYEHGITKYSTEWVLFTRQVDRWARALYGELVIFLKSDVAWTGYWKLRRRLPNTFGLELRVSETENSEKCGLMDLSTPDYNELTWKRRSHYFRQIFRLSGQDA